jgi:Tfp pilus assembly protein PilF
VELDRLDRTATSSLDAYDHFLKGIVHLHKFSNEENQLARSEFESAIELDPRYSKAIAKKAWTYLYEFWNDWGDDPEGSLILAKNAAHDSIEADPSEASAHHALGAVRLFLRKHDLAISSFRKAVELNPNAADLMTEFGWALTYSGLPDEGVRMMDEAISRSPYYPGWYLWNLAWGQFVARRYEEAIEALEERTPKSNFTHLMLAVNYAKVGRQKASSDSMNTFRKLEPGYSIDTAARTEPFKNAEDLEHYIDALREVGLPEQPPDD